MLSTHDRKGSFNLEEIFTGKTVVASFAGTHQYAIGGISACGLAALNCARVLFEKESQGLGGMRLLEAIATREVCEVRSSSPTLREMFCNAHLVAGNYAYLPTLDRS